MSFSTLTFLFLFFPVVLAIYYLIPIRSTRIRTFILLLFSLVFYAWGDIRYLPLLLLSVLFNYLTGQEIALCRAGGRADRARIALIAAVIFDVAVLAVFKYSNLAQPIGISFYTFSALSYVFDIYMERAETDGDLLHVAFYILFFPKLISGPVVQYKDLKEQIDNRVLKQSDLREGVVLFLGGLFKKVLLADNLSAAYASVTGLEKMAGATAFLGILFYGLQLYFDFSGYSDMAIGLSRMFGFRLEKNFNYPYASDGIADFWRRWHISLGAWFRNYVYIPLGGNRCSREMQIRNLMVVWLLTGIWHGNTLNYVIWGLYHGVLVLLERFVIAENRERVPKAVRILITDILVYIGWIFFFSPDLGSALAYFGRLFGTDGVGFANGATAYYLSGNLLLLAASLICCSPLPARLQNMMVIRKKSPAFYVYIGLYAVLFLFCVANMVGSTYSSFLYFQF